ncbi:MAG TPA: hypothetical protein VF258_06430 [Luteolibacter sp.]
MRHFVFITTLLLPLGGSGCKDARREMPRTTETPAATSETQAPIYPIEYTHKFTTPDDVVLGFLASISHGNVVSALNCFDFGFYEVRHSIGRLASSRDQSNTG